MQEGVWLQRQDGGGLPLRRRLPVRRAVPLRRELRLPVAPLSARRGEVPALHGAGAHSVVGASARAAMQPPIFSRSAAMPTKKHISFIVLSPNVML